MFSGPVQVEWLEDGREMKVLEWLSYTDPRGTSWTVPAGAVVDGASIPWVLWRVIGSPFVGKYRRASVFHDYHCETRRRSSSEVHRMFHDAMIEDGTNPLKAWLMWAAVRAFGPRF